MSLSDKIELCHGFVDQGSVVYIYRTSTKIAKLLHVFHISYVLELSADKINILNIKESEHSTLVLMR